MGMAMRVPMPARAAYTEDCRAPRGAVWVLGIPVGAEVRRLRRVRYADDIPLAVLDNILPLGRNLPADDELASTGLHDALRRHGIVVASFTQSITARGATEDEAALLDIGPGEPVLSVDRVSYDDDRCSIEYGQLAIRADIYSIAAVLDPSRSC